MLAPQALLQFGERQGAAVPPGDNFSVEDEFTRQLGHRAFQFRELGDFIERAREKPGRRARLVRLRPDAVVLVLRQGASWQFLQGDSRIFYGTGQHESDGMKHAQAGVGELVGRGQAQGFADVAGQHIGALHLGQGLVEGHGDSLLHQVFPQADAQVAGDDFDDVLGFEGRRTAKQFFEQGQLRRRPAALGQLREAALNLLQGNGFGRCLAPQQFFRHRAQVAVLAVGSFHGFGSRVRHPLHRLPDQ